MKKVGLLLCILAGPAGLALADNTALTNSPTLPDDTTHVILRGVVKSVSWADPNKGTKSEIVVINAARKPTNILVTPDTTLWDDDAKAIMPDKIVPKSHVDIIYLTTPEGINIGKSIKVLK